MTLINNKKTTKDKKNILPVLSFLFATLIAIGMTMFLGIFIIDFYINPLYPFIIILYTVHPLCRYKFNYKAMAEHHSLWKRLVTSYIIVQLLRSIAMHANKIG